MDGISSHIKGTLEISLASFHHLRLQQEMCYLPLGRGSLIELSHAGTLILGFPASRTVTNTFVLFNHSIYSTLLLQSKLTQDLVCFIQLNRQHLHQCLAHRETELILLTECFNEYHIKGQKSSLFFPPANSLTQLSSTYMSPRTDFVEDNSSSNQGLGGGGWFQKIQVYFNLIPPMI